MATIAVPNTFSPNTTISSSEVNNNFSTIYNEFNGSIDAANLATDSVVAAKIASNAVTTAKIADSSVTSTKMDFGGSGAGVWWEEIGRTTLTTAGDTITVSGFSAKKHLYIKVMLHDTGGTINGAVTFNNDSGLNYALRASNNGGADATNTNNNSFNLSVATESSNLYAEMFVMNFQTQPKLADISTAQQSSGGSGTAPTRRKMVAKWVNTADQITRIDVSNGGTGDFAVGSEVVVMGHD